MASQAEQVKEEPVGSRPDLPKDYGIPEDDEGLVKWSTVNEWMEQTKVFWIGTTWPDGRPHAIPIWGAWVENKFFFDGSPATRWARNLAQNPGIVVHIERGDSAVMAEGTVEAMVVAPETHAKVRASYGSRYDYVPEEGALMYVATPRVVFAWDNFPKSVTRFKFTG
jgi:hypothetical protein